MHPVDTYRLVCPLPVYSMDLASHKKKRPPNLVTVSRTNGKTCILFQLRLRPAIPTRPSRPEPKSHTAAGTGTGDAVTVIEYEEAVCAEKVQLAEVASNKFPESVPLPCIVNRLVD